VRPGSLAPALATLIAEPIDLGVAVLGGGTTTRAPGDRRAQNHLQIDVQGASPNLIVRLLIGSYITGQDRVCLTGPHGLTRAQRSAVHRTADRILGMSVVEDTPSRLEVQNFVDPSRYELPRLVDRIVRVLQSELILCRALVADGSGPLVGTLDEMEQEVDRLYLLIARQLLLSSDSPTLARQVNVTSHHYQLGYRLVAKVLEVTGDLIFAIGQDLRGRRGAPRSGPPWVRRELVARLGEFEDVLMRTMSAFAAVSAEGANRTLDRIERSRLHHPDASGLGVAQRIRNRQLAIRTQRVLWHVSVMLEMMVIINEVTINRSVEPERGDRLGALLSMVRARPEAGPVRPSPTARIARHR